MAAALDGGSALPEAPRRAVTAHLMQDASGNFNGPLYATTGTYFGMLWNPSDQPPTAQVGTASFQPTSRYAPKFIFVVNGPPVVIVTKTIQRQFVGNSDIRGSYSGVASTNYAGCANPRQFLNDVDITVTQDASGAASIVLNYIGSGTVCTYSGNLLARGKLYQITTAQYTCCNGFKTTAKIDQLMAAPHGIEGVWSDHACRVQRVGDLLRLAAMRFRTRRGTLAHPVSCNT